METLIPIIIQAIIGFLTQQKCFGTQPASEMLQDHYDEETGKFEKNAVRQVMPTTKRTMREQGQGTRRSEVRANAVAALEAARTGDKAALDSAASDPSDENVSALFDSCNRDSVTAAFNRALSDDTI